MEVKIKKTNPEAVIPNYATSGASGFDLVALKDYVIMLGQTVIVDTGLAFAIPEGYELQVRPRSGLSAKTPLRVANSPGSVDADFRGSVGVIMWNSSELFSVAIKKGDRIAQGVVCPVIRVNFLEVDTLDDTIRGAGGFGSTGV